MQTVECGFCNKQFSFEEAITHTLQCIDITNFEEIETALTTQSNQVMYIFQQNTYKLSYILC